MTTRDQDNDASSPSELGYLSGDPKIQLSSDSSIPDLTLTYTINGWTASGGRDMGDDTYAIRVFGQAPYYYNNIIVQDQTVGTGKSHYCASYWEWTQDGYPSRFFQSITELPDQEIHSVDFYGAVGDTYSLNLWLEPVRFFKIRTKNNSTAQYAMVESSGSMQARNLVISSAPPTSDEDPYTEFGLLDAGNACQLFSRKTSGVVFTTGSQSKQQIYVGYPTQAELDQFTSPYPCQTWSYSQKSDSTLTSTSNVGNVWNISGSSKTKGASIQMYGRGSGNNMQWTFESQS